MQAPPKSTSVPMPSPAAYRNPVADDTRISLWQADLETARSEYLLRRYDSVAQILDSIVNSGKALLEKVALSPTTKTEVELLIASANSLLGRMFMRKGDSSSALHSFEESVSLFRSHESDLSTQRSPSRLYSDYGIALFRLGQKDSALAVLRQSSDSRPAPQETFGYLGLIYKENKNYKEAEDALVNGLKLAPGEPILLNALAETRELAGDRAGAVDAYRDAARVALQLQDLDSAFQLLGKAFQINPTDEMVVSSLVNLQCQQNQLDKALRTVDAALQKSPEMSWALGLKGKVLRLSGNLVDAIKVLTPIKVNERSQAWVLVELARALQDSQQREEAFEVLKRAAGLSPDDAEISFLRGEILLESGKAKESLDHLEAAVRNAPQWALAQYELGRACLESDDVQRASALFDECQRLAPNWPYPLGAKAAILLNRGERDEAVALMRTALRMGPVPWILENLIGALRQDGHHDEEALEELEGEIKRDPQSAIAYWLKGSILYDQAQYDAAIGPLQTALHLQPDHVDAQLQLTQALRFLGRYGEVDEACKRLMAFTDSSPLPSVIAGIYQLELAEYAKALEVLESAVGKWPDEPSLFVNIGWGYEYRDMNSADRALKAYERAASLEKDNLLYRRGVVNSLYRLGDGAADAQFERLIKDATFVTPQDPLMVYLVGWCLFRVRRYDDAMRLLQTSSAVGFDAIPANFDLALATLCSGRGSLARDEYARSLNRCGELHPLRQRGVLYIAAFDLVEVQNHKIVSTDIRSHPEPD